MSQFCQPCLNTNLDSSRFVGNNTHELIVLPSLWVGSTGQVHWFAAAGFPGNLVFPGNEGSTQQSSESNGRLSADRKFLGRGVFVEVILACGVAIVALSADKRLHGGFSAFVCFGNASVARSVALS
jgi:hypothetical protein